MSKPEQLTAFPVVDSHEAGGVKSTGMALRDYFAAQALPQIMRAMLDEHAYVVKASGDLGGTGWDLKFLGDKDPDNESWAMVAAMESYKVADAMLAARDAK